MPPEAHQKGDVRIGPLRVHADAGEVAEFAAALGLQLADSVPLTFPIRWLALPAVRESLSDAIGATYLVHASQSFDYAARIERNRDYGLLVDIRHEDAPSPRIAVNGKVQDSSDRAALQFETVLYPISALSAAAANQFANKRGSLPEVEIGPVDMSQVERYAAAAQDSNRLHRDIDFVRAIGLGTPIVPGMMMMGAFQKALSEWRAGAQIWRLYGLFTHPVPVGSNLGIGGRIMPDAKTGREAVRLLVRTEQDHVVCVGEASIGFDPASDLPAV